MEKGKEKTAVKGNDIDLRTERTRTFIEENPGWWLRWGTTVTILVFLLIAILIAGFPYPHSDGVPVWRHLLQKLG